MPIGVDINSKKKIYTLPKGSEIKIDR